MRRRTFVAGAGGIATAAAMPTPALANTTYRPSAVIAWNDTITKAFATAAIGPTVAGRALSMAYEAIYNAWAAYGSSARFTLSGMRTQPRGEWRNEFKTIAIAHAARNVMVDLFPAQQAAFDTTLAATTAGLPVTTRAGIAAAQTGQLAAALLLQWRRDDGANQANGYADTSGYVPLNTPDAVIDLTRWQPLRVPTASGGTAVQTFLTPHWGLVRPFAMSNGAALRPLLSPATATQAEIDELLNLSANLNDTTKCQVDFFANNPGSVTPPGQWMKFAELVAANDRHSLDRDVAVFFVLAQAMFDASIAAWDCKRHYDFIRPISLIRTLYRGQMVRAWGGVGTSGPTWVRGEEWMPYQRVTSPTPNFAEFVSGHSTFSGAAAAVLKALRGSDSIRLSFTIPAGGIRFDPTVPAAPVTLSWNTLSAVAAAAGMSRRYGGIHFEQGDLKGRALGAKVAEVVLQRCASLIVDDDDDD
jgi:membrane-associated phospholipid phosphatase